MTRGRRPVKEGGVKRWQKGEKRGEERNNRPRQERRRHSEAVLRQEGAIVGRDRLYDSIKAVLKGAKGANGR